MDMELCVLFMYYNKLGSQNLGVLEPPIHRYLSAFFEVAAFAINYNKKD